MATPEQELHSVDIASRTTAGCVHSTVLSRRAWGLLTELVPLPYNAVDWLPCRQRAEEDTGGLSEEDRPTAPQKALAAGSDDDDTVIIPVRKRGKKKAML